MKMVKEIASFFISLFFKKCCIVFVICRLGNDSQIAVRMMQKEGIDGPRDIIGGLLSWSTKVDESFPIY